MDKSLLDFTSLLEAVPYGFVLINKPGFVEACNTVARSMFQYRNIDIIGFQSKELLSRADRVSFVSSLHRCLQVFTTPAKYTTLQLQGLRKDGTIFPVEIHMKTSYLSGRELIACTFRDITRRRQNEDSIRKKEEKLQLALQGGELWLWEHDCRTNSLTYEVQNSLSSSRSNKEIKMEQQHWINLIHPDDKKQVLDNISKLQKGETNEVNFEYKIKRKNGNWDWIYTCSQATQRDENGQAILMSGTNINISERKYAEERLQKKNSSLIETEKRLRLAQESGGVACWERDAETKCLTYHSD